MVILNHDFFARATVEVARDLLGATLRVRAQDGHWATGRIVETEAYGGAEDTASHAARGPTTRSRIMFGPAGRIYIYLIYGVHYCLNLVTEENGVPGAVLIRAVEPLTGHESMARRRGLQGRRYTPRDLCGGPGRLCQALGIDLAFNGRPVREGSIGSEESGACCLEVHAAEQPVNWQAGPRIGLSRAQELPWRFVDPDSDSLSR